MSKRFHIDPNERAPIYETDPLEGQPLPNVIYIRARMNYELACTVESAAYQVAPGTDGTVNLGVYLVELLVNNVLAWAGPDFDDLACTPENIRALPGNDPFIVRVRDEIARRNKKRESPNEGSPVTPSTSMNGGSTGSSIPPNGGESLSLRLATTTPKLHSRIISTGHRNRSDD